LIFISLHGVVSHSKCNKDRAAIKLEGSVLL